MMRMMKKLLRLIMLKRRLWVKKMMRMVMKKDAGVEHSTGQGMKGR